MHRLFIPPQQLASPRVKLTAEQARYLGTVLRLRPGEEIEVFDGEGARFRAWLEDSPELDAAVLRLDEPLSEGPARAVDVTLVQALAKGEKMDLVVQKATELGAMRIVPLASERAVVKVDSERGSAKAERWRKVAQEAARQSGRADVPKIDEPASWDAVLALLAGEPSRRGLLLDPGQTGLRLGQAARGARRVLIAVGPEGGFSPEERERAVRGGMLPVALGPLVLRTETAGLAALAVVLHVHGELG
ncbi:MAG: 16S rRNA (uracil(1498)-N(3))-methyltransferase [Myxococcales bacterium]|nr:16S rRNA (uracil(1498)-N(3))-methyltransferase [Myxococcales bacterium]